MSTAQLPTVFDGIVKNLKFLGADGQVLTAGKSGKVPPGQVSQTGNVTEALQYYYHPDHLGSTSYVTDATGEVYQHLEYFAFGETFVEEHSNTDRTPYLFNGKELDEETGLYYYGARYYQPTVSVWLSVDPMTEELAGWNPYTYARANPITFIDPDGQWPPAWWQRSGTRVIGGLKVIGGVAEMVAGGAVTLIPEPTLVTKVVGIAAVVHGSDVASSGLMQLLTGEDQSSLTSQAMQAAGMSKQTADMVDGGVSTVLSGGAGALANASKVTTNANQLSSLTSIAAKTGQTVFTQTAKEGDLMFYSTRVGDDVIEFGGNFSKSSGTLTIKNFDIDGALTNKLGIRGIKSLITAFGKQQGVKQVVIEGAKRTTGANPGKIPSRLVFNIE